MNNDVILLVDDDPIALLIGELVINHTGFGKEVIKLENGQQAYDFYRHLASQKEAGEAVQAPTFIFLDLNMPIMSGWDFLEDFTGRCHRAFPETKVVIVSSTLDPSELNRSKSFPCIVDFISKPISPESLASLKQAHGLA